MTLEQELFRLAESNLEEFYVVFRRVRTAHPKEAACACFRYLAKNGCGDLWPKAQFWILANNHLDLLLAPDVLDDGEAVRVGVILRDADPQFFIKLKERVDKKTATLDTRQLERIVKLYQGLSNAEFLVPWLRMVSSHSDDKVRSLAGKQLCFLRPNRFAVERQLKSEDPRVRANAVEALWTATDPEIVPLLRSCLKDAAHRVVVNALIAMYRMKVPDALPELIRCGDNASPLMRQAAVWGMRLLADPQVLPALRKLTADPVSEVSSKALAALLALGVDPAAPEAAPRCEPKPTEKIIFDIAPEVLVEQVLPVAEKEVCLPRQKSKSDILGI